MGSNGTFSNGPCTTVFHAALGMQNKSLVTRGTFIALNFTSNLFANLNTTTISPKRTVRTVGSLSFIKSEAFDRYSEGVYFLAAQVYSREVT